MKKNLVIGVAILSMAISFVGCSAANASTSNLFTEEADIVVGRTCSVVKSSVGDSEYYAETIGLVAVFEEISAEYDEKVIAMHSANMDISTELTYNENYKEPTNVKLTGEMKDGKTYFYYNGYVTTLDGEKIDYNKEVVCDFTLEPDVFNFELDD